VENERLEFKEAKNQFDTIKLMKYCVSLANEGGGYFIPHSASYPLKIPFLSGKN
jgi:hypothetical protein